MHAAILPRRDLAAGWLQRLSAAAMLLLLVVLTANPTITLSSLLPGVNVQGIRGLDLSLPPVLSMAAVALWILSLWLAPARRVPSFGHPLLAVPLIGLVALSFATVPFAVNPAHSLFSTSYHVLLLAIYVVVVNSSRDPWPLVVALAVGSVVQAVVGWPQFLLGHSIGLQALGEPNLDATWPGASVVMTGDGRLLRAYGLAGHPNVLGGYLAFSIPLISGYLLHSYGKRRRPSLILSVAVLVALSTLLATFSRAAWLGVAIGGASMYLLLRRRGGIVPKLSTHARLLAVIAMLVIAGFIAGNWQALLGRFGAEDHATEIQSIEERSNLNAVAWNLALQRPVTGVGLGNYVEGVFRLLPERYPDFPNMTVHNVPLLAAAELGALGGLLWICLMLVPWVALWRIRDRTAVTPWCAGLYGALAALAVVSMFDYYLWCTLRLGVLQWLAWGLWAREWNVLCG